MNYFLFIITSAYADLMRNKARTFLTTLGIVIGVASVVLLQAFGLGLKAYIKGQFDSLGTNLIFVLPGNMFRSGGGGFSPSSMGTAISFDEKDLSNLKRASSAEIVVPSTMKNSKIGALGKNEYATIYGTSEEIFPTRNLEINNGTFFLKSDVNKRAKVAVIGPKIAEKLFGQAEFALDQKISVDKITFKIIGVLKSKGGGGFGGPDFDSYIYIPYKTAFLVNNNKNFSNFVIKATSSEKITDLKNETDKILLTRYKEDDFSVAESKEILNTVESIFAMLNMVLIAIGAVSLVVGGIGIMNIMYVSVTERIREIGIRRAMGALEKDILLQFLSESVLLSLLGGILGLLLSFGIVLILRIFFPAYIDLNSMMMAILVSSAIGVGFGLFPARSAAKLLPIEAIRYE
jgi:putative ABC transport system permease protein